MFHGTYEQIVLLNAFKEVRRNCSTNQHRDKANNVTRNETCKYIPDMHLLMTGQALRSIMCGAGPHGMIMMMGVAVVITMMAIRAVLVADADTAHTVARVTTTKHTTVTGVCTACRAIILRSYTQKSWCSINRVNDGLQQTTALKFIVPQTYEFAYKPQTLVNRLTVDESIQSLSQHRLMKEQGRDQSETLEALVPIMLTVHK
uniref:Uncharacterized protein n=1 Tax=Glossina austeni TaxID=7395 RepID=A0A1A9VXM9_GLOAU